MDFKIVNPSDGRRGGVIMLWKIDVDIQQLLSAPNYIDVKVTEGGERMEAKWHVW
jgi:hypothetical protein